MSAADPGSPVTATASRSRLWARELVLFFSYLGLTVLMTWPLVAHLSTAVISADDPYVSASILEWDCRSTLHDPLSLFELPVFHPAHDALAFTEHLYGIALFVLPFYLFGAGAVTLHSVATLLGFAFCGYGALVLGRVITRSTAAGFAGGVVYAFLPYRFHHLPHVSYIWSGWLPLLLAALLWYSRAPSWKRGLWFGAAFLMNGLTCLHWLAFGSMSKSFLNVSHGFNLRDR